MKIHKLLPGSIEFLFLMRRLVKVKGVCSELPNGKHALFWDFDMVDKDKIINSLLDVQYKWELPTIYLLNTGVPLGYHAYCLRTLPFEFAAFVLLSTKNADRISISYGIRRGYWVLRFTPKGRRDFGEVISLPSDKRPDCEFEDLKTFVEYYTLRGHCVSTGRS